MLGSIEDRIIEFKKRMEYELEFCEELYKHATIRLLAAKYAYYVKDTPFIKDITYDGEEKTWYVMGRALGHLKEDETSPCIDWDFEHPLAKEAIILANRLI